jgi:hypothetical protein
LLLFWKWQQTLAKKEKAMLARLFVGAAAIGVSTIVFAVPCYAQATDLAKQDYHDSCAPCHGTDGKGAGPIAPYLKQKVPDLTMLTKNNAGVFPFALTYDVIDGRQAVAAHGPRDMPVWGRFYREEGAGQTGGFATSEDLRSFVRGRIIALIGYIYTLQAK